MIKTDLTQIAKKALSSKKHMEMLFENIYPKIWHFYCIRLNNEDDAKDLTQNACIKVVKNLDKFNPDKGTFLTWMYRVIQNMLFDFFRKKSLPIEDIDFNILESTETPLNDIIKKENKEQITAAFNKLGHRQKEIIEMKYFFNMRNKEIAQSLDIKENTVSSLITRALEKLQLFLEKDGLINEQN